MAWDPEQYARFRDERAQPFHDLLALVRPRPEMRVVDLGCGPGELTKILHEQLGAQATLGIDSSPEMLAKAEAHAGEGLRFELGDIGAFAADGSLDLVFSNAALHWLPAHETLFARLAQALAPRGQLAVQMPANFDHPSHLLAAELAGEETFRAALEGGARAVPVLAPEDYALLLHRLGFARQQVRLQVYLHRLGNRDDVFEWVKGSLLTYYQARLSPGVYEEFAARYRERLRAALADEKPFPYPFKRILLWGQRP